MKKKGSICDFTEERDAELMSCFRKCLAKAVLIDLESIFSEVAAMPTKRFYVSESRAAIVIRQHLRGEGWSVKRRLRVRMFEEIERRTLENIRRNPGMRFDDAVFDAVNSSAPCFYLTPRSCRTLIYRYLGGQR